MAAKNKPKRPRSSSRPSGPVDFTDVFALHVEGSQRRDELLEQVRQLQAAGKIREARQALERAETINKHLTALAESVRPKPPKHLS